MQTFNIDIAQSPAPLVLYAKQGDSLSRFFRINFLESGQPWTPPAGATFAVRYGVPGLPSGWYDTIQEADGSSHSAFGLLGNVLTIEIAYEAVSVSGRNTLCVLVLDSNSYQLGAWNLALQVEITPGENAPESTQYYSLLSAQVAQVLASVTDAENAATLAKSWAVGGTGTREGEDTNNAKYWADRAAASAGQSLGFRTFSVAVSPDPTTGDVDPTSPMLMSSLTATSAADRLDHVVIPGKTVQAGSGDPSPANVRPLTGVGRKMVSLDVTSNMNWYSQDKEHLYFEAVLSSSVPLPLAVSSAEAKTNQFSNVGEIGNADSATADTKILIYVRNVESKTYIRMGGPDFATLKDFKSYLNSVDAKIWYVPADESQATGWYTYAAASGDTYAAVGLPLNGPLYDGDKVSNDGPSGCDVVVAFDGDTPIVIQSINSNGIVNIKHTVDFLLKSYTCLSNKFPRDTKYIAGAKTEGVFNFDFDVYIRLLESTLEPYGHTKGSTETALTAAKAFFAENPVVVFAKSANYAPEKGVRVETETHERVFFEFDGSADEAWQSESVTSGVRFYISLPLFVKNSDKTNGSTSDCNWLPLTKNGGTYNTENTYTIASNINFFVRIAGVSTIEQLRQTLEQKPLQVLATLASPAVYAHPAQPLKNPEGEWELSGENTPVGYMRALTDADRADYADAAGTANQADNASKLGGKTLAQIAPAYAAAETAMPYTWVDGKTVYRQCLELAVSDFDQSTTEQFYPDYAGTNTETSTTQLDSKTVLLNGAALILPTSCATSLSSDGQSIRPISNTRPGGQGYELGWRFDKSGTGWKISVDIGRFLPSQFSKFLFVIYYTK